MVEHAAVNRRVGGSKPSSGAIFWEYRIVAIAGDCKSPLFGVRWFESICRHIRNFGIAGAYVGLKIQRNKFDSYRFHR